MAGGSGYVCRMHLFERRAEGSGGAGAHMEHAGGRPPTLPRMCHACCTMRGGGASGRSAPCTSTLRAAAGLLAPESTWAFPPGCTSEMLKAWPSVSGELRPVQGRGFFFCFPA